MALSSDNLSGASQLATLLAERNKLKGLFGDPADYQPPWVKLSGPEFNPGDPRYRDDVDPLGFLIGGKVIDAHGASIIILGMMSGVEEKDRVVIDGREASRRHGLESAA
jgi:hypothetical protein